MNTIQEKIMEYKKLRETRKEIIIVDEFVEVAWQPPTKNYYQSIGYEYTGIGKKFLCKVSDLPPKTGKKVTVKCPVCDKTRMVPYWYISQAGQTLCARCSNINDLTKIKFGRLLVLELDRSQGSVHWMCECECGAVKSVRAHSLTSGHAVSCGCYNREKASGKNSVFWNGGPVSKLCVQCGGEYKIKRSKKDESRFCSSECWYLWLSENKSGNHSTSWKGGPVCIFCDWCGKEFKRPKSQLAKNNFCSYACHGEWQSKNIAGEKHPKWNPDITDEERLISRNYPEYRQWAQDVLKNDEYTCQSCGSNQNLEVHHLFSYTAYPEYALDTDYGTTLCEVCHKCFHLWMGGYHIPCVPSDLDRWLYETGVFTNQRHVSI